MHVFESTASLTCLTLLVCIYAATAAQGGWRAWSRRALLAAHLLVGARLVAPAAPMLRLLGRQTFTIFEPRMANQVVMPIFALAGGLTILAGSD